MNFKRLPSLGAPTALAYFFTTAAAIAKDIDAQTLAKMSEASAVRVGCGVSDVDFISPAVENGSFLVGAGLAALIAAGVAVLLHRRGVALKPIVAWVVPLLVVVPSILSPISMYALFTAPFEAVGLQGSFYGLYTGLITFAVCAFILVGKVINLITRKTSNAFKRVAVATGNTSAVRKVVYKRDFVSETDQPKPTAATASAPPPLTNDGVDIESARATFEKSYNNGVETEENEADDTACLTR